MGGDPVRARAVALAESLRLDPWRFVVREMLDIYNDDRRRPLRVEAVRAETWLGHHREAPDEDWGDLPLPLTIPPDSVQRVAAREHVVTGQARPDRWVRWIRFVVTTPAGPLRSNFAASPGKPPAARRDPVANATGLDLLGVQAEPPAGPAPARAHQPAGAAVQR